VISASPDENTCKAGSFVMDEKLENPYVYENFIRAKCRWSTVLDYDEFITFKDDHFLARKGDGEFHTSGSHLDFPINPYGALKHHVINETTSRPNIFSLAWFHIGSDGHRERPEGFVTDIYQHGKLGIDYMHLIFLPYYAHGHKIMKAALNCIHNEGGNEALFMNAHQIYGFKSIGRTAAFDHWWHPHYPVGLKPPPLYSMFEKKPITLPAHCGREHEASESPTLLLPRHDLYIRHYRFYSLSEFMQSRGAFNHSALADKVNACNHVMRLKYSTTILFNTI
jgi:hypothetical protein